MHKFNSYVQEMRPKHYVKNLLIFVPLFFSGQFLIFASVIQVFFVFCLFSFLSSSIYFINDIVDYPQDILHPTKAKRPIASGKISRKSAVVFSVFLFAGSMVGLFFISWQSALVALGYYVLNLTYSFWLKKVALLDVFCIAIGFVLRVFVGSTAINVVVSHWLLLTIFCLSLFLAFGKRRNEIMHSEKNTQTRKVLESYDINFLDKSMFSMMTLAITFYALWTLDTQLNRIGGGGTLIFTVPIVILALLRYMSIVETATSGDPTNVILEDKFILVLAVVLVILLGAILYL